VNGIGYTFPMEAREIAPAPEDDGPIGGCPCDAVDDDLAEYLLDEFAPLPRRQDPWLLANNRLMGYIERGILPRSVLYEGQAPDYDDAWGRVITELRCEEIDRALENIARAVAPEWPIDWRYDRP
jgi:hypothetical protein